MKTCSIDGCNSEVKARGWCGSHYSRWSRYGTPMGKHVHDPNAAFDAKYTVSESGCWVWHGALAGGTGYGNIRIAGKCHLAHRYSYERFRGPIPAGAMIDHVCFKRSCVNPDHLRVVTSQQNTENREGANSNSRSGVRGVSYDQRRGTWYARAAKDRKVVWGGSFVTREEAEVAARRLRQRVFTHSDR